MLNKRGKTAVYSVCIAIMVTVFAVVLPRDLLGLAVISGAVVGALVGFCAHMAIDVILANNFPTQHP